MGCLLGLQSNSLLIHYSFHQLRTTSPHYFALLSSSCQTNFSKIHSVFNQFQTTEFPKTRQLHHGQFHKFFPPPTPKKFNVQFIFSWIYFFADLNISLHKLFIDNSPLISRLLGSFVFLSICLYTQIICLKLFRTFWSSDQYPRSVFRNEIR